MRNLETVRRKILMKKISKFLSLQVRTLDNPQQWPLPKGDPNEYDPRYNAWRPPTTEVNSMHEVEISQVGSQKESSAPAAETENPPADVRETSAPAPVAHPRSEFEKTATEPISAELESKSNQELDKTALVETPTLASVDVASGASEIKKVENNQAAGTTENEVTISAETKLTDKANNDNREDDGNEGMLEKPLKKEAEVEDWQEVGLWGSDAM